MPFQSAKRLNIHISHFTFHFSRFTASPFTHPKIMKHGIASIEEVSAFDTLIDVRTPAEFAEDHLPGSINCPVLSNEQRVEVGSLYKQVSPFAAKKVGAAYVSENIARHLRNTFCDREKDWLPLVLCWRGGERSGAMTHILRRVGWNAHQLAGGYKAYRKQVLTRLEELPATLRFIVVCGATGSGKSRILQALAGQGKQVLDLEALASHKGSVLGVLPDMPQPAQKMFESQLLLAMQSFDPARPVFVEAESRKIGMLCLPDALLGAIRSSPCIRIEAGFQARVDFLLHDYDYFLTAPEWLNSRLATLKELHGNETLACWKNHADNGRWRELVSELLAQHYDPLYQRSQNRNFSGFSAPQCFSTDDLSPAGIDLLAQQIGELIPA